ncbi:MAG: hypothetical protein JSW13_02290, partial [Candidatus Aerophobus sp.]
RESALPLGPLRGAGRRNRRSPISSLKYLAGGVKKAENKAENFKAIWWIGTTAGLFREVGSH